MFRCAQHDSCGKAEMFRCAQHDSCGKAEMFRQAQHDSCGKAGMFRQAQHDNINQLRCLDRLSMTIFIAITGLCLGDFFGVLAVNV